MRKHVLTVLGIASFLVLFGVSIASAGSIELLVEIPFDFMAGNRLLPAGSYIVTRPGETHTQLTIQSKQGQHGGVMVQPNISQPVNTHGATKLVFNRYGDRYFLSQIWTSKRRDGYVLRQSDQERGLARELAQNGNRRPEVVSIAASVP